MMDSFSKITYVDAFYISDDTLEGVDLYPHTGYGKIVNEKENHLVFSFIQKISTSPDTHQNPERGLLLPKASLEANYREVMQKMFTNINKGDTVYIEWNDIVYFEGVVPDTLTRMYTEGKVAMKTNTFLVVKDPVTIRTCPLPIKNHPAYTPFYYVLPLALIKKIELSTPPHI